MQYVIVYHHEVLREDIPRLSVSAQRRIASAIEQKLTTRPYEFGKPLRHAMKQHRTLRVGDYRIVFRIADERVLVLAIRHRKDVYSIAPRRE